MAIITPDDVPIPTRDSIYTVPGATLTRIADAIRSKTGGHAGIQVSNMASEIQAIPTGGGGSGEPSVIFIDYDGTVVEEWTADQLASKTALPNNPSHDRLVAQGWNWSLADIKSYVADYPEAVMTVGQMYDTASGLTEFDITVTKVTGLTVTCKMAGNKNWGDGTSDNATTHTYADYGDYTITCDGTVIPPGNATSGGVFGSSSTNVNRYWCRGVRISSRVTSIGAYAFEYCYSLKNVTIPNSVTSIGSNAFQTCYSFTSVTIPNGVTSISYSAFNNCRSLVSVAIPNGVTIIDSSVFQNCTPLASVTIPNSVASIGASAFSGCYSFSSVTIPNSVTYIGVSAFSNCHSLVSVTIPNSVTNISSSAFTSCDALKNVTIQNGVTSIGSNAFNGCRSLASVTIPNSVTSIDSSAFGGCYSLKNVTIPNGVTSIGSNAFQTCYLFTSVTIPNGVTNIGSGMFQGCYSCIEYNFTASTRVPTLGASTAFASISSICKILVPAALYDEWIAATNWATYADYIYPV